MVDRWKRQKSKLLKDYGFIKVRQDSYLHPDMDGERKFLVIDARDWVNVIAVTPEGQIVLIRQFRYGVGGIRWEIPAGVIEPEEAPVDAAIRELREETGYEGIEPELLCTYEPNPAIQSNLCSAFVIREARKVHETEWDDNEVIEVFPTDLKEVERKILSGEFSHALLQLPLVRYLLATRS
jgi:8-oxo-dGTP pyrophosphatase MutT (NUDIX family)